MKSNSPAKPGDPQSGKPQSSKSQSTNADEALSEAMHIANPEEPKEAVTPEKSGEKTPTTKNPAK
jgi:hypothetical protein